MKFDIEVTKEFENTYNIDYGIVKGNNIIVFIKAGQDGSLDQSINYVPLFDRIKNDKIRLEIVDGADHYFSNNGKDFYQLPEKYLF